MRADTGLRCAVQLDSSIKQTGGMVQAAISEQARLREQLAACKQGVEDAVRLQG